MAEYLTNTADLTAVADAIRAKGGTAAQLVYPAGFVSAIQAIQTGVTPQLIVTTSAGAAVTATKGSKTVSGTAGADGTCTLELSEAGEWSVTASLNGNSKTKSVLIGTQTADITLLDPVFANNSWAKIAEMCQSGNVPDTWAVGDSKTMTINGTEYQIDIIGKNHDTYADGSGAAPLTFQLHDCYPFTQINSNGGNYGGWKACEMRTTFLSSILALMPTEVQNGIREVSKITSTGATSTDLETVSDKLFLLSEVEIRGYNAYSVSGEGAKYDYYDTNAITKKYNGSYYTYWTRSPCKYDRAHFVAINSSGSPTETLTESGQPIPFAFCF